MRAWLAKQRGEHVRMTFRGSWYPHCLAVEPVRHLIPSLRHRKRAWEYACVRGDPQKRQQTGPRQTHSRQSVDLFIKPVACCRMLGKIAAIVVDEKVAFAQYHLN